MYNYMCMIYATLVAEVTLLKMRDVPACGVSVGGRGGVETIGRFLWVSLLPFTR